MAEVTTHLPEIGYDLLLQRAGCFPRDVVTQRIVREVRTGTGGWGRSENDQPLQQGLQQVPPQQDSDLDGMADASEAEHGLDPNDRSDHRQVLPSGYTAIEEYCHDLAQDRLSFGLTK